LGTYFKIRINETQSGHTKEKNIVGGDSPNSYGLYYFDILISVMNANASKRV